MKTRNTKPLKLEFPPIPSAWRSRKHGTRHVIDRTGGHEVVYMQGRLPREIKSWDGSVISLEDWHEYQKTAKLVE